MAKTDSTDMVSGEEAAENFKEADGKSKLARNLDLKEDDGKSMLVNGGQSGSGNEELASASHLDGETAVWHTLMTPKTHVSVGSDGNMADGSSGYAEYQLNGQGVTPDILRERIWEADRLEIAVEKRKTEYDSEAKKRQCWREGSGV